MTWIEFLRCIIVHVSPFRKLYNYYGDTVINLNGPIPAHLLGNMWAQDWNNIYDLLEPYGGKVRPDATPGMIEQVGLIVGDTKKTNVDIFSNYNSEGYFRVIKLFFLLL